MMNRNSIPLVLMLLAGAITCVFTFIHNYPIWGKLLSLLIVLLVFFLLGNLLRWTLDIFDLQNARREKEKAEASQQDSEDGQETQEEAEEE